MDETFLYTPRIRGCVAALAAIIIFAALSRGAHDVWAATIAYLAVLALAAAVFWIRCLGDKPAGLVVSGAPALAALALAVALSCALAVNPGESFAAVLDWLSAMGVFWIALNIFQSEQAVQDFLALAAVAVWIELAVNVFERFSLGGLAAAPAGTLVNADIAAAFVIGWIAPFLGMGAKTRSLYWRATAAAALLAVVLFASKWAVLCLLAAFPFFIGLGTLRRWIALTAALAAFLAFLILEALKRGMALAHWPRILWWASGFRMFWDHPWLGIGLGNYPSAYLSYKVGHGLSALYVHGFPLEILSETGVLGFAAFGFFLAWWLRRARVVKARRDFVFGAGLMFAYALINVAMEYWVNLAVFWIFLGVALAPVAAGDARWKPKTPLRVILTALAAAAIPYIIAPFVASRDCVAGAAYLARSDYAGAARAFQAAAGAYPPSYQAQEGLAGSYALAYEKTRDAAQLNAAILHQEKAIARNKRDGPLFLRLGDYQRAAGLADLAERSYALAAKFNAQAALPEFGGVPFPGQIPNADARMAKRKARQASGRIHERR